MSRPLQFGRIVHEMLDAEANRKDPFKVLADIDLAQGKLFKAEREMYGELVKDIRCIMSEYFAHYDKQSLRYIEIDGRSAEHEFNVPITNRIVLTGKIDRVVKLNGLRLLMEHKTFNRMPSTDEQWRNLQSASYVRAMELMDWPEVDGTLWDYIHSKPPTRPQLLKNGKLSSKGINTLPSRVIETVKAAGLKPADYAPLIKSATSNRDTYFKRVVTPLKPKVVNLIFRDLVSTARDMEERHGDCKDRNIDRHCSYCDYEPLCRAAFQGLDTDYIKEKEYVVHVKDESKDLDVSVE